MKHLAGSLAIACLAACTSPGEPPAATPVVAAATPAAPTNACPAKTEILFEPEPPTSGFVPAAPSGATLVRPMRLQAGRPDYPAQSIRCREEGDVTINFCVTAEGRVENAQVATSSGFARLDNSVLAWAARDRYTPGAVNGRPRLFCGLAATLNFAVPTASETTPAR